jgi:hypothetical protein
MNRDLIKKDVLTAFLFAGFWVLLVCTYKLIQMDGVSITWKYLAAVAAATFTYLFIGREKIVSFAGFCMLMVALNYLNQDEDVPVWLKIAGVIAVLLQLGTTLGARKENAEATP